VGGVGGVDIPPAEAPGVDAGMPLEAMAVVRIPGVSNTPVAELQVQHGGDAKAVVAGLHREAALWPALERHLLAVAPTRSADGNVALRLLWRAVKLPRDAVVSSARTWLPGVPAIDAAGAAQSNGGDAQWITAVQVMPQVWRRGDGDATAAAYQLASSLSAAAAASGLLFMMSGRATDGHMLDVVARVSAPQRLRPLSASTAAEDVHAAAVAATPRSLPGADDVRVQADVPSVPVPAHATQPVISLVPSRSGGTLQLHFDPPLFPLAVRVSDAHLAARWRASSRAIRTAWRAAIATALQPRLDMVREAHSSFHVGLQWDDAAQPAVEVAVDAPTPAPLPKPAKVKIRRLVDERHDGRRATLAPEAATHSADGAVCLGLVQPRVQLLKPLPRAENVVATVLPAIMHELAAACAPLAISITPAGAAGVVGGERKRRQPAPGGGAVQFRMDSLLLPRPVTEGGDKDAAAQDGSSAACDIGGVRWVVRLLSPQPCANVDVVGVAVGGKLRARQ